MHGCSSGAATNVLACNPGHTLLLAFIPYFPAISTGSETSLDFARMASILGLSSLSAVPRCFCLLILCRN